MSRRYRNKIAVLTAALVVAIAAVSGAVSAQGASDEFQQDRPLNGNVGVAGKAGMDHSAMAVLDHPATPAMADDRAAHRLKLAVRTGDGGDLRIGRNLLVRKNVKDLTKKEKRDFVGAIKKLKGTPAPDGDNRVSNWYDHFVAEHVSKLVCWNYSMNQGGYGHMGSDLLTFHRAFLIEFEAALATVAGKPIPIPYWKWSDQASTDAMLSNDMMGPSGKSEDDYYLTSGPFRRGKFRVRVKGFPSTNPAQADWIQRAVGTHGPAKEPPTAADIRDALARPKYNSSPWDVTSDQNVSWVAKLMGITGGPTANKPNPGPLGMSCADGVMGAVNQTGETLHTQAHDYIGGVNNEGQSGSEADVVTSPNDPAFWLIHSYIDLLAEKWWKNHESRQKYVYLPTHGGPRGTNINDIIEPYTNVTNGDMAVPSKNLGYEFK